MGSLPEQTVHIRIGDRSEYLLGVVSGASPSEVTENIAALLREAADVIDQTRVTLKLVNE